MDMSEQGITKSKLFEYFESVSTPKGENTVESK